MKILFIASEINGSEGGIQAFNRAFTGELLAQGQEIAVVAMNDIFRKAGFLRKPLFVIRVLKTVLKLRPGLIVCAHLHYAFLCRIIAPLVGAPYVCIVHGIEAWNPDLAEGFALKGASRIVSVSHFTKNRLLELLKGLFGERFIIIHDTVDEKRFFPQPKNEFLLKRLGLCSDDKVLLSVGRLCSREKYKGVDRVTAALKAAVQEVPTLKYLVVGKGDDEARLRKVAAESGLNERIIFAGYVPNDELAQYYNLADCFVMPSKGEGFGIVFLEALACGKPCIAGSLDASSEALLGGRLGLLVDPEDPADISRAIVRLFSGQAAPLLYDGESLRREMLSRFGKESFARKIKELLSIYSG